MSRGTLLLLMVIGGPLLAFAAGTWASMLTTSGGIVLDREFWQGGLFGALGAYVVVVVVAVLLSGGSGRGR